MYRYICILAFLLSCIGIAAQTATDSAALRALQVGRILPQERVYLHFDNTSYYLGETIWFKAFVTCDNDDRPTALSRILYVELVAPEGYIIKTEKYRIGDDGTCSGEIYMDPLYLSGYYEIRAYTRYMLNWGEEVFFSRVFPVFDKVNEGDWGFRNMLDRGNTFFANKNMTEEKKPELRFYPESGHLIYGIEIRVAYELTGYGGKEGKEMVTILADGKPLLTTAPEHMGKGSFMIKPVEGTDYTAKVSIADKKGKSKTFRFDLPEIEETGAAIAVRELDDSICFSISNRLSDESEFAFAILHRSNLGFYKRLERDCNAITVAKDEMPEGVCRAIIFSGDTPLAERLFFVRHDSILKNDRQTAKLKVTGNGYMLHNLNPKPHEKIAITVEREDGKPIGQDACFAVSVTDQGGRMTTSWGYNLYTYMLLGSELKGYIPDAQQYFDPDNPMRAKHLDLIMLTHGWTAYDWSKLTARSLKDVVPAEKKITLRGEFVLRVRNATPGWLGTYRITSQPYNLIRFDFAGDGKKITAETFRTDSAGRFSITVDDFYGKYTAALSPNTLFKHSARINYGFYLDRYFSPPLMPLRYWQRNMGSSLELKADTTELLKKINTYEYLLSDVSITANKETSRYSVPPISELRLDYLEEWEYAMDITYRHGLYDYTQFDKLKKEYEENGPEYDKKTEIEEGILEEPKERLFLAEEIRDRYELSIGHIDEQRNRVVGYAGVLSVQNVLRSIYMRYNLGWQNWVYPAVVKGEYNKDSIPEIDEKYLHGINPEAMTNFKEVILTSDKKKRESVEGSWGIWERRGNVLQFKYPYGFLYEGFLSQLSIRYALDSEKRNLKPDAVREMIRLATFMKPKDMSHPNNVAYLIPEKHDSGYPIKNDLSVSSSTRRYTSVQGYSRAKQFYSPDYSTMKPDGNDFRRTIMWNPDIKAENGKLNLEFYNSTLCNAIAVDVMGYDGYTVFGNSEGMTTRERKEKSSRVPRRYENDFTIKDIKDSLFWAQCDQEFSRAETYYMRKNYKRALSSYIELSQYQYPAAFYRIGEFYYKGISLNKRYDLAAKFYERGAELGMPECYYELSRMHRDGLHYEQSREKEIEMLEIAADLSETRAQHLLATYLLEGNIIEKDTARATELFYKASLNGNPDAMYMYAEQMLRSGIENDSILGSPLECIREAVKKGSNKASLWLMRHEIENGNHKKAYKLAKELYIKGDIEGTRSLAEFYMLGLGVRKDRKTAKDLYTEAAKKGDEESRRILKEW